MAVASFRRKVSMKRLVSRSHAELYGHDVIALHIT